MRQLYIFKTAQISTAEDIRKLQQVILTAFFVIVSVFLQTIAVSYTHLTLPTTVIV